MRKKLVWLVALALLLMPSAFADEGAIWIPVPIHYSWDLAMAGSCTNDNQCLINPLGNASYDGDVSRYFRVDSPSLGPRCLNDSQHILDYACEKGNWTTRTKHVALQLLQLADTTSPTDFSLFCDTYNRDLNQFQYLIHNVLAESYLDASCLVEDRFVPCVNSICVLRTPTTVAVGTALNVPVNDPQHSFLLALDKNPTACHGIAGGTAFSKCGAEPVWYNPALEAVILLPTGTLSAPAPETAITGPLATMSSYVMAVLNEPNNPSMNFAYFPKTRLFGHLAVAQNNGRGVFGFLEPNMRPEYDPVRTDYIGVRYTGIDLSAVGDPCLTIVKKYDAKAFCENQTGTPGFNIIARHRCEETAPNCQGASPIVAAWPDLTAKLRP